MSAVSNEARPLQHLAMSARQRRMDLSKTAKASSDHAQGPHDDGQVHHGFPSTGGASALRMRQLEGELQSLRDMYAQKIARTEMKCESLLQEKDQELATWRAENKRNVEQMQATVTIMAAIFNKRRRRAVEKMHEQEEHFKREKLHFEAELAKMKEECRERVQQAEEETLRLKQRYEQKLHENALQISRLQESLATCEAQLRDRTLEAERLRTELTKTKEELVEVQCRLEEVSQADALTRLQNRIDDLEAELVKVKRRAKEKASREAQAFRAELLQYVKFILHLLPEDRIADWKDASLVPVEEVLEMGLQAHFQQDASTATSRCDFPSDDPQRPLSAPDFIRTCQQAASPAGGASNLPPVSGRQTASPRLGMAGTRPRLPAQVVSPTKPVVGFR
mmetsp:Transcript_8165/g.18245  ORF Transcript_8165/g.18245 Transcript_8165/m.18245 type:complete len:394 (+) Transcript_8165:100-1281(+)